MSEAKTKEALKLALEALEKALRYHGVMLLSDPPQDAWKYHRVEQTAHEAITAIKEALSSPTNGEAQPAAMKTVIEAMQQDPDYAWGWHCNIAMSFVDAGGDHYTGNQGAARFMRTLANVEPAHELPSPPPQRTWVGLTGLDIEHIQMNKWKSHELINWIEAKLKEKNT